MPLRRSKSKRKPRKSKRRNKSKCKKYLQDKIRINMHEYKQGRYKSPKQALAVSYSQIIKKHPSCKRILKSRSKK